jgi:hypothetical protein
MPAGALHDNGIGTVYDLPVSLRRVLGGDGEHTEPMPSTRMDAGADDAPRLGGALEGT